MTSRSLLARLLWRMGAITLAMVTVIATILILAFKSQVDDLRDRSLQGQANDIARHLTIIDDEPMLRLPTELMRAYTESKGGFVFAVIGSGGRLLFASKGQTEPIKPLDLDDAAARYFFSFRSADQAEIFYGASLPISVDGRNLVVQVAQGPRHRDVLIDSVFEDLIVDIGWVVPVFLLCLMVVTYLSIKQSLTPLTKASAAAAAIGPAAAHLRVPESNIPSEIRPLVRAINAALGRLEKGIAMQRAFTADAAHELRTPLAILKAHVQTLPDPNTARALSADVSTMERIIEQLLSLAQVEGYEIAATDHADLHAIAIDVATMLAPRAARELKTVEVVGDQAPLIVAGNTDLVTLAVRNLVENGLQHTPPGSGVEISLDPRIGVTVIDHGPGISEEHKEHIFQRFWRGDRNRGNNAGLGLSIVKRCLQLCGGDVTVEDSEHGGAVFTIRLPRPLS